MDTSPLGDHPWQWHILGNGFGCFVCRLWVAELVQCLPFIPEAWLKNPCFAVAKQSLETRMHAGTGSCYSEKWLWKPVVLGGPCAAGHFLCLIHLLCCKNPTYSWTVGPLGLQNERFQDIVVVEIPNPFLLFSDSGDWKDRDPPSHWKS